MEEVIPILPILTPCARTQIRKPTFRDSKRAFFLAKKMLPEYVFDASKLENNPLTFPEVQTLLDGVSIDGRKITDVEQVLNIRDAWNFVFSCVRERRFTLDLETYCSLHALVARNEALEWGKFRTGNVGIAGTKEYKCPPAESLPAIFQEELPKLVAIQNPIERAICVFLWGASNLFFWDGNKRTSRLTACGILLSEGIGVFNIRANDIQEFNSKILDFYETQRADEIALFLSEKCIVMP